jgi:hypothetical protein
LSEKARTIIYEGIGRVKCSPPGIEYQSSGCEGIARYVCHHCKAPLCAACARREPDEEFPVFSEPESISNAGFYVGLLARIAFPAVLFVLVMMIRNLAGASELALADTFYTDFQSVRIATSGSQIAINVVALLSSLAVISAISIICTTYVRTEADESGRIKMKIYEKRNLSAVHCRHCWERYHENRSRILERWIPTLLAGLAVVFLLIELWFSMVDLTIPLVTIAAALTVRSVAKRRLAIRIE